MYPTLFYFGARPVSSYDFFLLLGYLTGICIIFILIRRQRFPLVESWAYVLFATAVSILGAKIFLWIGYFMQSPAFYIQNPEKLWPWPRGRGSTFGALLSALLFSSWYLKKFRLPFWRMGVTAAPGMAMAQSVMKIGCFMAGCCYGTESRLPWAVTFPGETVARHPTQIYESILYFINFLLLLFSYQKKKFSGQVLAFYIINFSIFRFISEYFRGDPGRKYLITGSSPLTSLSFPQFICLGGIVIGIALLDIRQRNLKKKG